MLIAWLLEKRVPGLLAVPVGRDIAGVTPLVATDTKSKPSTNAVSTGKVCSRLLCKLVSKLDTCSPVRLVAVEFAVPAPAGVMAGELGTNIAEVP